MEPCARPECGRRWDGGSGMRYFNIERRPRNGQYDDLAAVNQATTSVVGERPNHILIAVPDDAVIPDSRRWTETTKLAFESRKAAVKAAASADPRTQQEQDDDATLAAILNGADTDSVTKRELKAVLRRTGLAR